MPYPDPPGPRIAYDVNGTAALAYLTDGVVHDIDPTALKGMNSERTAGVLSWNLPTNPGFDTTSTNNPGLWIALMFPVATRLMGAWVLWQRHGGNTGSGTMSVRVMGSTDSTNGSDGEWHLIATLPAVPMATGDHLFSTLDGLTGVNRNLSGNPMVNDLYRRAPGEGGPQPLAGAGTRQLKAVRFEQESSYGGSVGTRANQINVIHIYGEPDTTANDQRLAFWQPAADEIITPRWFDWLDVPVSSSADKSFRIKNMSASDTATDVLIDALAPASTTVPAPDGQMLFSADGGTTWTSTLNLAALSPGAVSGVLRVRRTTPADAPLSNWAPRIIAEAMSWS